MRKAVGEKAFLSLKTEEDQNTQPCHADKIELSRNCMNTFFASHPIAIQKESDRALLKTQILWGEKSASSHKKGEFAIEGSCDVGPFALRPFSFQAMTQSGRVSSIEQTWHCEQRGNDQPSNLRSMAKTCLQMLRQGGQICRTG
jgi:hypothetical protein